MPIADIRLSKTQVGYTSPKNESFNLVANASKQCVIDFTNMTSGHLYEVTVMFSLANSYGTYLIRKSNSGTSLVVGLLAQNQIGSASAANLLFTITSNSASVTAGRLCFVNVSLKLKI